VDPQADRIWCILTLKSSTWRQQFWWYTWELFTRCGVDDAVTAYSTGYCACNVVYSSFVGQFCPLLPHTGPLLSQLAINYGHQKWFCGPYGSLVHWLRVRCH